MIAHAGQSHAYGRVGTSGKRCFLPLRQVIEDRWLTRLDSDWVRRTKTEVWRNGHQAEWYDRWVWGNPGRQPPNPKPPAELPEYVTGSVVWLDEPRIAA
jgi:hypothetical protein